MTWLGAQVVTRTAISIAVAVLIQVAVRANTTVPEQPLLERALDALFLGMTWAFGWRIGKGPRLSWSATAKAAAKRRVLNEELDIISLGIARAERLK